MYKIKKCKYDLIIGIGQNCLVSELLRENSLMDYTTPFDWVQIFGYDAAINILKNKFQNFFCKDDLEFAGIDKYRCFDVFYNKRTKIAYVHDFDINAKNNFDEIYEKVNIKLQRRIARLLDKIANSKNICLIYVEYAGLADKNIAINNDIIFKDIEELKNIYNNNFDIFYVKHNPDLKLNEYVMNDKICEINNSILEYGRYEYRGNKLVVGKILKQRVGLKSWKTFFLCKTTKIKVILKKLFLAVRIYCV